MKKYIVLWAMLAGVAAIAKENLTPQAKAKAEEIVQGQCFVCHGISGESSSPLYPRLAGQNAEYITKQLGQFKSGVRKSDTMQPQVLEINEETMKAIGAYYEAKTAHNNDTINVKITGVGQYIFNEGNSYSGVPACSACHGANGHGTAQLPRLAGQRSVYTVSQLKNFNKRIRTNDNEVMHSIASKLTELEMYAVAEYIASLK